MKRTIISGIGIGSFLLLAAGVTAPVHADDREFESGLSGAQEAVFDGDMFVPGGTDTNAVGRMRAVFTERFGSVWVNLRVDNLSGSFTGAHLHCGRPGENGPVAFGLVSPGPLSFDGKVVRGILRNEDFTGSDCTEVIGRPVNNIAALAFAMADGLIYINVHTDMFPGGEIRGQLLEKDDDDDD